MTINPNTLAGFISRWKRSTGFTDSSLGFWSGVSDVGTGFNAPTSARGGWAAAEGVANTWKANTGDGPVMAPLEPGMAYQGRPGTGAFPDQSFTDGSHRIAPGACTMIFTIRNLFCPQNVTAYTSPGSLTTKSQAFHGAGYFEEYYQVGIDSTGRPYFTCTEGTDNGGGGGNQPPTAIRTVTFDGGPLSSGREIIAVIGTATSLSIGVLGATGMQWTTVSGIAPDHGTVGCSIFTLGGDGRITNYFGSIIEDVVLCSSGANSQANVEAAALYIRNQYDPTFIAPTIQIDALGDSITSRTGAIGCYGFIDYFARDLKAMGVPAIVCARGVASSDAASWNNSTFMNAMVSTTACKPTITTRIGLGFWGANALAAVSPPADTAWISDVEGAIAKYRARSGASSAWMMTPICNAFDSDVVTHAASRAAYRAKLLASTAISGVIDLDTLCPDAVPQGTDAYAVGACAGSIGFTIPDRSAAGAQLAGSTSFHGRAIGIDGLHPGPILHARIGSALLRSITFAQAVGAINPNTFATGRLNRSGRD